MDPTIQHISPAMPVVTFQLESRVVSRPGAALEVRVVTIPDAIKQGIAAALAQSRSADVPKCDKK